MMSRISLTLALLFLVLAFPTPFQTKCYIVQGKMVCCDNYGMCN